MKTEKQLQNYLRSLCKTYGVLFYKFSSPNHRGVPDLILIGRGRVVFVELKSPSGRGRVSPLQQRELDLIRNMDVEALVIDCPEIGAALVKSLAA